MKKKMYLYFYLGKDSKGDHLERSRCQIETGFDQSIWFRDGDKKCQDCTAFPSQHGYDPVKSQSSTKRRRNNTKFKLGDYSFFGAHYSDSVCFATNVNIKIPEFHFFLAERRATLQSIMFNAGCLIGLAQRHRGNDAHLFTSQLKEAGMIKKNLFSMSYHPEKHLFSRIFFGGVNTRYLGKAMYNLHYHPIVPSQSVWTVKMD
eukprot:CAMPEP_0170487980 /NCGR_PEP_ID=MMETSP0208-20121228/6647_1 /TAXON_ID=197538 /ORGANISM="Strombidium inclinatum, Strain S3" /LENGTH=202 /DNA_ID=CAMNT_0010762411 /DNA_START=201 /DNA_END=809 /DNA_ORIENTATION=-